MGIYVREIQAIAIANHCRIAGIPFAYHGTAEHLHTHVTEGADRSVKPIQVTRCGRGGIAIGNIRGIGAVRKAFQQKLIGNLCKIDVVKNLDSLQTFFGARVLEQADTYSRQWCMIQRDAGVGSFDDAAVRAGARAAVVICCVIARLDQEKVIDLVVERHGDAAHTDTCTADVECRL